MSIHIYINIYQLVLDIQAALSCTDYLQNEHKPFKNGVSLLSVLLE